MVDDEEPRSRVAHVMMDWEVPSSVGEYVCTVAKPGKHGETLTELDIIDGVVSAFDRPVVAINAVGPPGIGKSMMFRKYAEMHQIPVVHVQGKSGTIPEDLQGKWILKRDTTEIILGPIATAIQLANDHGRSCLIVDEVNLFPSTVHPIFNNLLDYGKSRTLDGTMYRLRGGDVKLHVFFTMNRDLVATQQLQEAFNERLVVLPMGYPGVDLEARILQVVTGLDGDGAKLYARVAEGLRNLHKNEHAFRTPPGTREIVSWVYLSRTLGIQTAFDLVIKNGLNLSKKHAKTVDKLLEAVGLVDRS
ncbi:MAG: AAA family ATPase [Promethearchaeota archaeon]